jgi:hypothetical protein
MFLRLRDVWFFLTGNPVTKPIWEVATLFFVPAVYALLHGRRARAGAEGRA